MKPRGLPRCLVYQGLFSVLKFQLIKSRLTHFPPTELPAALCGRREARAHGVLSAPPGGSDGVALGAVSFREGKAGGAGVGNAANEDKSTDLGTRAAVLQAGRT